MSAILDILALPVPASLQDCGRPGYRHLGVPLSGALDVEWLQLANALVGNPLATAAIEMRLAGPQLRAAQDCVFAIAGDVDARLLTAEGERPLASWHSHRLRAGEQLRIAAVNSGVAYLAFAGGIDAAPVLGSRSTYARAGLGEILQAGGSLKVGVGGTAKLRRLPRPPRREPAPLRILPGPQREHFTADAWDTFLNAEFEVSREADRMGLRLAAPLLAHTSRATADIVSDAVTPGVIQVPGDGRAIVLLADCQTVGGYPKIGVVIGADLPRLAHLLPGMHLRFTAVTLDQALAARRLASADFSSLLSSIEPIREGPDTAALYDANLISGVIHAD